MTTGDTAARHWPERLDVVSRLDEAAFTAFYERSARALWAYVYRMTSSATDADDIVQESFCRLLRAGPTDGDEERWRRYLYRVGSNLVVDRWRKRDREERDTSGPLPAALERASDTDRDVARAFATLRPRERALLWLAYVEEETHDEIAGALGLGRHSVKVLLFRAKRRLRDLLISKGVTHT